MDKLMTFKTYHKIKRLGDEENKDIFLDGEIVVQEKMDGANMRFMFKDKLIFGSRTQELQEDKEHKFAKNFTRCINFLRERLKDKNIPSGFIFYGECMVAHSMQYNWEIVPPFLGFDIYDINAEKYLDYQEVKSIYEYLDLPMVPLIGIYNSREIPKIDDSFVPISKYAILSGEEDVRKAEGIVLKNYSKQIFAKYVRDKFKEINAQVFGSKQIKYNSEDDTGELIFKYCTNQRIDKIIFKLLDEGNELSLKLMPELIKRVLEDIYQENSIEILKSNWIIDCKKIRQMVPKRCIAILNQVITNNTLNTNTSIV